jgi:hypothetical protein
VSSTGAAQGNLDPAGELSTADIIRLLSDRHREIDRFVADEEAAFLALA